MEFYKKLIDEINKVRKDPNAFAEKLLGYKNYFEGNYLVLPGSDEKIETEEGFKAYEEASNILKSTSPLPELTPSKGLGKIAADFFEKIKATDPDDIGDIDLNSLILNYGSFSGVFENIIEFGNNSPELIVTNCIVCDGNPDRENRNILLSKDLLKIGMAFGAHETYGYCIVILSCTEFKNVDNSDDLEFFGETTTIKKELEKPVEKVKKPDIIVSKTKKINEKVQKEEEPEEEIPKEEEPKVLRSKKVIKKEPEEPEEEIPKEEEPKVLRGKKEIKKKPEKPEEEIPKEEEPKVLRGKKVIKKEPEKPVEEQNIHINEDKYKDISYNCTECSSIIEILSLYQENNFIKFKCLNKNNSHEKTLSIKEYLQKMKNHYNKQLNDDICKVHINKVEKYVCYCFNCKNHLCRECLESRIHLKHNKNCIMEIQPIQEELNIMKEVINYYKTKVEKLKNENTIYNKNLDKSLNDKKSKLKKMFEEQKQKNEDNKLRDLKLNNKKFILEIKEIKRKYEEELRIKKIEYEKNNTLINNEYKERNKKNEIILDSKINELHQKYNEEIERLGYDKKIENLNSIVKFNEIVYHTYLFYNQNYYNCINLNNLIINYYKNENIKNNVIKKILKNDYDKLTKLILERKGEYENEIGKEDQKGKENDQIRILEMDNKNLKEQLENQGMENMKLKKQMALLKKKLEDKEKNLKADQNNINE